ncbi:MAG: GNAT family N-acetyltransferase [Pseudomonadota bacterium]
MEIRTARTDELAELSALCLRSKAWWGYDDEFMEACREELSLTPGDLESTAVAVLADGTQVAGVAQVDVDGEWAELDKLFIDPSAIGTGAGRTLWEWSVETARDSGAVKLEIVADPGAASFYEHMGAVPAGSAPSGSIAGRSLPRLVLEL